MLSTPIYSHEVFDVVHGAQHVISAPEVLIIEGLNLLQGPPAAPIDLTEHLDHTVYLDAPPERIESWFVSRFLDTTRRDGASPDSFCLSSSRWIVMALSGFFISCATPAVRRPTIAMRRESSSLA